MTYEVLTAALAALQDVADGVAPDQFDHPTPCGDWTVGQVLLHAAGDQHAWAATVGSAAMPSYNPFEPPREIEGGFVHAVQGAAEVAAETWERLDRTEASVPTPLPPVPTLAPEMAAGAAALDAAIHAWDVAVATSQRSPLTVELARRLRPAAEETAEPLRGFAYGPPLAPAAEDDDAAALLRYLGRDPYWS